MFNFFRSCSESTFQQKAKCWSHKNFCFKTPWDIRMTANLSHIMTTGCWVSTGQTVLEAAQRWRFGNVFVKTVPLWYCTWKEWVLIDCWRCWNVLEFVDMVCSSTSLSIIDVKTALLLAPGQSWIYSPCWHDIPPREFANYLLDSDPEPAKPGLCAWCAMCEAALTLTWVQVKVEHLL